MSLCRKLVTEEGKHWGYRFTIRGTINVDVLCDEDIAYDSVLVLNRGEKDSSKDVIEVSHLGLTLVEVLEAYNFFLCTGASLAEEVQSSREFGYRRQFSNLLDFLNSPNENVFAITGLSMTGKTVLLYQVIDELISGGTSPARIVYLRCPVNGVREVHFDLLLEALTSCGGIDYLFIDDVCGSITAPRVGDSIKLVLSSSKSSSLASMNGVCMNHISFTEFEHLCQPWGIATYVRTGGTLDIVLQCNDLREAQSLVGSVLSLQLVGDIESTFKRRTPSEKYPVMWQLWRDHKYLATVVLRTLQKLYISDIANDLVQGFLDARFGLQSDFIGFSKKLFDRIASEVPDIREELTTFLKEQGYLLDNHYFTPLCIKLAIEADFILEMESEFEAQLNDLNISKSDFEKVAFEAIQTRALRDIIYSHLEKVGVNFTRLSGKDKVTNDKFISSQETCSFPGVDFVLAGQAYRVVASYNMSMPFFRGLMRKDVLNKVKPSGVNVLYYNKIMCFDMSPHQLYQDIKLGIPIEDLEVESELVTASDEGYMVRFMNAGEFIESCW